MALCAALLPPAARGRARALLDRRAARRISRADARDRSRRAAAARPPRHRDRPRRPPPAAPRRRAALRARDRRHEGRRGARAGRRARALRAPGALRRACACCWSPTRSGGRRPSRTSSALPATTPACASRRASGPRPGRRASSCGARRRGRCASGRRAARRTRAAPPTRVANALLALAARGDELADCHDPERARARSAWCPRWCAPGEAFNVVPAAGELIFDLRADRADGVRAGDGARCRHELDGVRLEATMERRVARDGHRDGDRGPAGAGRRAPRPADRRRRPRAGPATPATSPPRSRSPSTASGRAAAAPTRPEEFVLAALARGSGPRWRWPLAGRWRSASPGPSARSHCHASRPPPSCDRGRRAAPLAPAAPDDQRADSRCWWGSSR